MRWIRRAAIVLGGVSVPWMVVAVFAFHQHDTLTLAALATTGWNVHWLLDQWLAWLERRRLRRQLAQQLQQLEYLRGRLRGQVWRL